MKLAIPLTPNLFAERTTLTILVTTICKLQLARVAVTIIFGTAGRIGRIMVYISTADSPTILQLTVGLATIL